MGFASYVIDKVSDVLTDTAASTIVKAGSALAEAAAGSTFSLPDLLLKLFGLVMAVLVTVGIVARYRKFYAWHDPKKREPRDPLPSPQEAPHSVTVANVFRRTPDDKSSSSVLIARDIIDATRGIRLRMILCPVLTFPVVMLLQLLAVGQGFVLGYSTLMFLISCRFARKVVSLRKKRGELQGKDTEGLLFFLSNMLTYIYMLGSVWLSYALASLLVMHLL